MNVLLVHNFYQQPGGEDQVFADEGMLLEQHGHSVSRITFDNDDISAMGRLELARKTIWNRESQKLLKERIQQTGAEVVHFHNTFPLISPAAYYAAHEMGAAVVQTLHNYRLMCPAATFCRDGRVCEQCEGRRLAWPAIFYKCYRSNRAATTVAAGMLLFHKLKGTYEQEVDAYIALTQFAAGKFARSGLPAERILVKSNFVSPDPGMGKGNSDFVLFAGRLTEEKGIRTLLEAWNHLGPRRRLLLKIIGDGPLRPEVEAAARENDQIEYLGHRKPPEVYQLMGDARLLVFPSQWYEGQPRTILESLAKGTPIMASRLGSMPELVEEGRTGLLFDPGNAKDLASRLESVIEGRVELEPMRRAARAEFEAHYTADKNYPRLMECYEQAINRMNARKMATYES